MRISDWSSDVCSSDLASPGDWINSTRSLRFLRHGAGEKNAMPKLHTLVLAGGLVLACPALAEPPPPIEDFVRHPTYSGTSISPTGEYLAITVDRGDQDVLTVLRTSDLKNLKINQLPDKKSVGSFHWVSPERLMFNAVKKMGGYAAPFQTGEWFAVNADGSKPRPLIFYGTRDVTQRGKTVGNARFTLLATPKGADPNVTIQAPSPRPSRRRVGKKSGRTS